jgi:hypothetical protein
MSIRVTFGLGLAGRLLPALALTLAALVPGYGQVDSLAGLPRQLSRYQQAHLPEKLFLHLDRPLYSSGETMWFKVYAVDGTYSRPLALSSVAYVEVLDAQQQPVLQAKVALQQARGQGSFVLPATLASGSYTVRAYTSWMKNTSPDYYFHQPVTVINTAQPSGPATRPDSTAAAYEVQLFPEGGNLVQGLRSQVAFKVSDQYGRGIAATGQVRNQQGQVLATFTTLRHGLGSFALTPQTGQTYSVQLTLANRQVLQRPLPRVFEQGYVLHLAESSPGQLALSVQASTAQAEPIYLLAHSRQKTALARQATLVNGQATFLIDKAQLLDGISHFTLFNAARQPLCERLYFQRPTQALALTARPDQARYTTRGKVSVQVAAALPAAATASLSMAVYRLDSLNTTPNLAIDRYLALSSDLPGRVEDPDYYFSATGPEVAAATDHLMLTQGWSRFRWEDVLASPAPTIEFLPELNGHLIRGQLTPLSSGKSCAGVMSYLSVPGRLIRLSNSLSNKAGQVQFELNDFYGTQDLIAQTDPRQDSTCRLTLLNPFSTRYASAPALAFDLSTRFQADYARRHLHRQVQSVFAGQYQPRFAARRIDSLAFFGSPNETYLLDKYTRFQVLEEVLREYVPGVLVRIRKDGYHLMVVDKLSKTVQAESPLVLVDGVPMFNTNKLMAINPLKLRKLDVVIGRYFHGLAVYPGVVSFTTYQGDLDGVELDPRALVQQYEGLQPQREFYAPRYATPQDQHSRLPDLRNLLYWNPSISLSGAASQTLEFYTGDQAGRYLVVLQGLSSTGLAGSTSTVLEVKPVL